MIEIIYASSIRLMPLACSNSVVGSARLLIMKLGGVDIDFYLNIYIIILLMVKVLPKKGIFL